MKTERGVRIADRSDMAGFGLWGRALVGLLICAVATVSIVVILAFTREIEFVERLDVAGVHALEPPSDAWLWATSFGLTWTRRLVELTVVFLAGIAVASSGERRRRALIGAGLIAAANVTTQALKDVFATIFPPELAALPSGHTTAALSVGAALAIVAAARFQAFLVAVLSAYAGFAPFAVVAARWHRPLDAVAAAVVVTGMVFALAFVWRIRWPLLWRYARDSFVPAVGGALVVAAAVRVLGSRLAGLDRRHDFIGALEYLALPLLGAWCVALAVGVARARARDLN